MEMKIALIDYISKMAWFDIVFVLAVPFFFVFVVRGLWQQIKYVKKIKQNRDNLEAQKCIGPHTWVKMPIMGQEVHVCKECCWSSSFQTYVKKEFVNAHLKEQEFKNALEEYSKKRKVEIAEKFRLFDFELEQLENEIYSIKKDFVVEWLEKSLEEVLKEEKEEKEEKEKEEESNE